MTGQLAQLVRAFGSHPKGHRFESCIAQKLKVQKQVIRSRHNHKTYTTEAVKCTPGGVHFLSLA